MREKKGNCCGESSPFYTKCLHPQMETKKTDPNWVLDGMWLCWFHKQLCCDTTRPPPGFPLWKKSVDFRLSTEYGPYERKTQFFQFMPTHSPKHLLSIGLYSKQGTFLFQICKHPSWIRMYDMLACWNAEKKKKDERSQRMQRVVVAYLMLCGVIHLYVKYIFLNDCPVQS